MAKGIKAARNLRNGTKALQHSTSLTSVAHVLTTTLVGAALMGGTLQPAMANPVDGQVVHGHADITSNLNKLTVNQTTNKAIINWREFSIGRAEHTHFAQPDASSITLNRVMGNNLSHIAGKLTATGQVMLVNPNGVIFGKHAQVDVQGLVATTANITDDDFINGNYRFNGAPAGSKVINRGSIKVGDSGIAALVAPHVRNSGVIFGKATKISLAGGDSFAIDLYGDGLVSLAVPNDSGIHGAVKNTGDILAAGGTVLLTTNDARQLVDGVVNLGSIQHASSARIEGDTIILDAGDNGTVNVAGKIDASGIVNASGPTAQDGGSIDIKGGEVNITQKANLKADGYLGGDGGNIKVKASNTIASIKGDLHATGSLDGQGGAVEIRGKEFLLAGTVTVGSGGNIIIDPDNLYVKSGTGTATTNTVYEDWIESQSQGDSAVTLEASKLIHVEDIADNEITGGSGDIILLANEGGSVVGAITFADKGDAITTTTGNIYLEAGSRGIDIGSLRILSAGTNAPGSITIKTVRNGNVTAKELQVMGYGNANIDVNAGGDVTIDDINALSLAENGTSTAEVTVKARRPGSDIDVGNVMVASGALGTGTASDLNANARLKMTAAGNLTVDTMLTGAGAFNLTSNAVDMNADAQANLRAGESLTVTGTAAVLSLALGQGNTSGHADASATSSLRMHAEENLNLNDTHSFAAANISGDGYENVSADSSANLSAGGTLTANGLTNINAMAATSGGTTTDKKTVSANSFGRMVADSGDVVVKGALGIISDASSDSVYSDHLVSSAKGRIRSLQGDVTVNAPLDVIATAYGNGAVPIEVLIKFLGTKAEYYNSFGFFDLDNGTGQIIWNDLRNTAANEDFIFTVDDLDSHGFFLIPNGAKRNTLPAGNSLVTLDDGTGEWVVSLNGTPLQSEQDPAYFAFINEATGGLDNANHADMNTDGVDHAHDDQDIKGNSNWEDTANGGDKDYDDANFDITYTYGAKATANAKANLLVEAVNGDVTLNAPSNVDASIKIEGSGYEQASADAVARYVGGENVIINSDAGTESMVDYQGIKGVVDNVVSRARSFFTAKGNTAQGNVAINGNVHSKAQATEDADTAKALVRADAANNILFGSAITDPTAQTETFNGNDSAVQGRTTMTQTTGNDRSRLIFNDQLGPFVPAPGGSGPSFANSTLNTIFIDPVERFLISLRDAGVQVFDHQKPYTITLGTVDLSLLGTASNVDVSNLSPEQLGSLAPAAGGMGGNSSINCAHSFLDNGYGQNADTVNCAIPNNSL